MVCVFVYLCVCVYAHVQVWMMLNTWFRYYEYVHWQLNATRTVETKWTFSSTQHIHNAVISFSGTQRSDSGFKLYFDKK